LTKSNPDDVGIVHCADPIFRKQRHGAWARLALLENLNGLAPGLLLTVIDLAQVKRGPLDDPATGHPPVFDQAQDS
jgi:hypothetical protein